jgi:hypothetical protein
MVMGKSSNRSVEDGVYERAGYDYFIDYSSKPVPPLLEADAAWMDRLLREKKFR